MKNRLTSPKSISIVAATAVFCLLIIAGSRWSGARPHEQNELLVKNQTPSLQLLSQFRESTGGQDLVTLQVINNASKSIVAYTILKQDQTMLTTNGATTGWVLAPSETDTVRMLIPNTDKILTIFAVLFDDGSSEGDFQIAKQLRDYRIGIKAQFLRAIPILRQMQNAIHSTAQLTSHTNELMNLPERHEEMNSSISKSEGAKHAKQFILNQLKLAEYATDKLQKSTNAKVNETLKKLEKAVSRLEP